MTKAELISEISEKAKVSRREADAVLNAFTEVVIKAVDGNDKVSLPGLGSFELVEKPAREGRNPSTGEKIKISASRSLKFKVSKAAKESLHR